MVSLLSVMYAGLLQSSSALKLRPCRADAHLHTHLSHAHIQSSNQQLMHRMATFFPSVGHNEIHFMFSQILLCLIKVCLIKNVTHEPYII